MFRHLKFINKCARCYRVCFARRRLNNLRRLHMIGRVEVLVGTPVLCAVNTMNNNYGANIEEDISRAIQEGEAATLQLMNQLKDFIVNTSEEYRKCTKQQIEIMQKATFQNAGPYSEVYDELPQYRTLANELKKDLTDYCTLFHTLVNMAKNKDSASFLKQEIEGDGTTEFQTLQHIVEEQVQENTKAEKELLQAVTDNILHEVLFSSTE